MLNKIKILMILLTCSLLLVGCGASDEKSKEYKNVIKNYVISEGTLVTLAAEADNVATISINTSAEYASIAMYTDDYYINQYYKGDYEYIHLKGPDNVDMYYKLKISQVFNKPSEIYDKYVFDPTDISSVSYQETIKDNGMDIDVVSGRISGQKVTLYFYADSKELQKVTFKDNSTLSFAHEDLHFPEELINAKETDSETINAFISQFTESINN